MQCCDLCLQGVFTLLFGMLACMLSDSEPIPTCCSGVWRPRSACDRDRRAAEAGAAPGPWPPAAGG